MNDPGGSDTGCWRAAKSRCPIEATPLNGLYSEASLRKLFQSLVEHPLTRVAEFLSGCSAPSSPPSRPHACTDRRSKAPSNAHWMRKTHVMVLLTTLDRAL